MTRSFHRCLGHALAMTAALAVAPDLRAQSVAHLAFVPTPPSTDGLLVTVDPDAGRVERTRAMPAASGLGSLAGLYVTADSRYIIWSGRHSGTLAPVLTILDQATDMAVSGTTPVGEFLGNPVFPEVYITGNAGPVALSPAGIRPFAGFVCGAGHFQARTGSISTDGRRVSFWCDGREAIFDTATGAIIRSFTPLGGTALSPDGQSFYDVYLGEPMRRYDVDSGVEMASVPPAQPGRPVVDPRNGHVYLIGSANLGPPRFDVYHGQTLQPVRSATVPGLTSTIMSWTFDRFRPRAYAVTRESTTGVDTYMIVDTDAMTILHAAQIPTFPTDLARWVIGYRPTAPTALSAIVTGANVALSWTAGPLEGAVSRHVLEVGSAPGLNDIFSGLDIGAQPSFAASGAPPGRYYVRVRAANYAGVSAASNEVVVQVP